MMSIQHNFQTVPISKKMESCLNFLDQQLEQNKKRTLSIAETIIDDIKFLTDDYYKAQKNNDLISHIEKVRATQFKWIQALQAAILEQSDQVLSHEVMNAMQKFAEQLNRLQSPTLDLELPLALSGQTEEQPMNTTMNNQEKQSKQSELYKKATTETKPTPLPTLSPNRMTQH